MKDLPEYIHESLHAGLKKAFDIFSEYFNTNYNDKYDYVLGVYKIVDEIKEIFNGYSENPFEDSLQQAIDDCRKTNSLFYLPWQTRSAEVLKDDRLSLFAKELFIFNDYDVEEDLYARFPEKTDEEVDKAYEELVKFGYYKKTLDGSILL